MHLPTPRFLLTLALTGMLLTGCQSKVYLMPPPIALDSKTEIEFFNISEERKDSNLLYTLYATNRLPYTKSKDARGYTIFPSDTLEIGQTVHRVGEPGMDWDDLYRQSLVDTRDEDLIIYQAHTRKKVRYHEADDLSDVPPGAEGFFQKINQQIDRSFDKDITVYVHGANSNFYRATAQGAQLYHFTGHNSLVLTFAWPSAGRLLKYQTDVLHAGETAPAFARLLEILAMHTRARNINVLAYSAGAQVAIPGLAYLRDSHPNESAAELKQRLRIGEVYLAAPDADFPTFTDHYLKFKDIVGRTTINLNSYDSVLRFAASQSRYSRLGRPNLSEISDEQSSLMLEIMDTPDLDILDVGNSEALELGGAHDSWYMHPWVSNDMILLLLFNVAPKQRGLEPYIGERGGKTYRFPANYAENIRQLIKENKEKGIQKKEGQKAYGD